MESCWSVCIYFKAGAIVSSGNDTTGRDTLETILNPKKVRQIAPKGSPNKGSMFHNFVMMDDAYTPVDFCSSRSPLKAGLKMSKNYPKNTFRVSYVDEIHTDCYGVEYVRIYQYVKDPRVVNRTCVLNGIETFFPMRPYLKRIFYGDYIIQRL